jgi:hypothetical protein
LSSLEENIANFYEGLLSKDALSTFDGDVPLINEFNFTIKASSSDSDESI